MGHGGYLVEKEFKFGSGDVIGRYSILRRLSWKHRENNMYECICKCGNKKKVSENLLTNREIPSCGCYENEQKQKMIGKKVNSWTIIGWNKSRPICECQCGTVRDMQFQVLMKGKSKSCGCNSYYSLIGNKIGRLKIIGLSEKIKSNGGKVLKCLCDCGNTAHINLEDLKKVNPTKSCGCIVKEKIEHIKKHGQIDLTNKKFGKWNALKYAGSGQWLCKCDCGTEKKHKTSALRSMKSTSRCRECYKTKINKDFFKKVDTQEKAYILGFLYADGCNYEDKFRVKIDIAEKDVDVLEKIKIAMEFEGDILHYDQPIKYFNGVGYKCQDQKRINICEPQISKDLANLGCVKNKTYELYYPKKEILPTRLQSHFIRGLIDGDGSIGAYNTSGYMKFHITLTGTTELVGEVSNILSNKFDCSPSLISRHPERNNNNTTMHICGNNKIMNILNWIYNDSKIHMNRKFEKYLEMIEIRGEQLGK